jgi:hypothetical protein
MAGLRRKVRVECVKVVRLLCDVLGKRRCFLNYRVSPVLYWCFCVCMFLLNRFALLWVHAGGYWISRNREGPRILTYIHTNIVHWSTYALASLSLAHPTLTYNLACMHGPTAYREEDRFQVSNFFRVLGYEVNAVQYGLNCVAYYLQVESHYVKKSQIPNICMRLRHLTHI